VPRDEAIHRLKVSHPRDMSLAVQAAFQRNLSSRHKKARPRAVQPHASQRRYRFT